MANRPLLLSIICILTWASAIFSIAMVLSVLLGWLPALGIQISYPLSLLGRSGIYYLILILEIAAIAITFGLWRLQRWAWKPAIGLATFGVFFGFQIGSWLTGLVNLLVVLYYFSLRPIFEEKPKRKKNS